MSSAAGNRADIEAVLERALRETSGRSVLFSEAVAARAGLSPADLESLDLLVRHGPMTAGRLAESTGLTTGAITGLIDRLERRGYARREPHPTDRRSVVVRALREEAERDLAPLYAPMEGAMAAMYARYGDDELALVADFLTRAAEVVGEVTGRLREETALRSRAR